MAPTEVDLYPGRVLNERWRVVKHIGDGNFGLVYTGSELSTGRAVAIKILSLHRHSLETLGEFRDEARYLRHLAGCSHVTEIVDSGLDKVTVTADTPAGPMLISMDLHYIVLELADGALSKLLLLDHDDFTWTERLQVFRDVIKGTHQMHLKHVVARDLKADNVLLFANGPNGIQAKVADLGRARITSEQPRLLAEEYMIGRGDLRFAAPELLWLQGADTEADWRSVDLYHLGSLLFEIVTGVGITSVVVPDPTAIPRSLIALSPAARRIEYNSARPDLQDRYEAAYEMFELSTPPSIRRQATALLRQLTSTDRELRFPRTQGRAQKSPGLEWLMRRVDILTLTLRNAQRQARRTQIRKETV